MSVAPQETPATAPAPALLRPGFGVRLGLAVSLVLLLAYGVLAATTVQRAGGLDPYVRKADFISVLTGAAILTAGHPAQLYDEAAQATAQGNLLREVGYAPLVLLPYNHPPFEAMLVAGWQTLGLSAGGSFLLWTLLSLAAVAAALAALRWGWPIMGQGSRLQRGLLLVGAALTFFPVTAGLLLGQSTALVLLGWAAGSAALRRGHPAWAGAAFALATLKPQAVPVLLLALLLDRQWRALAAWAGTCALAVVAAMPLLGLDWPLRYTALVLHVAAEPPNPAIDPAIMQNWRGLFIHLLGDSSSATLLTAGATVLSLALVAWIWLRRDRSPVREGESDTSFPDRERDRGVRSGWDRRWVFTLLVALLVDPHLNPHDLALALVPSWILAAAAIAAGDRRVIAWLWLGWGLGLVAALYHGLPVAPAVIWLCATAGAVCVAAWPPATVPTPPSAPGRPGGGAGPA